ncbi:hybrid sensor histidine kinase/response regulator [Teichococcus aestuarii]|uniref:histidine kinase n=1 Tax=Teichococcus aestuarii TaxID=568898 RepID=A0A2U1V3B0_9PROT|nr:ATP-binding protein [Pseudoroseomonas aestuarii]PWC28400.1 hybrid sensor histidine kinase/response regulator [Pseudoroseomonas aestuarii]
MSENRQDGLGPSREAALNAEVARLRAELARARPGAGPVPAEAPPAEAQNEALHRATAALAASEERFRLIVEKARDYAIFLTDAEDRITDWLPGAAVVFGWSAAEAVGQPGSLLYTPQDREQGVPEWEAAVAREKGSAPNVRWHLRRDGSRVFIEGSRTALRGPDGKLQGFLKIGQDVTERRAAEGRLRESEAALRNLNETLEVQVDTRTAELRSALDALQAEAMDRIQAEEALRQAQKMEAVGQLTGGIAHDFNNMLQGIMGSLELMQHRVAQGRVAEAERFVDAARQGVERAAALTHRLLSFARRQALHPRAVNPDLLATGMTELIRRTVGPEVRVELRLCDGSWPVLCDPNQLEHALLNLAINARDAMPEGGRLAIATRNVHLDAAEIAYQEGAQPGDYVEIAVTDTGTGMDEATKARAFEPFFTTKPLGQGTGLGLSQIYGFVRQSYGAVHIDSAVGQGTTLRLYLPRADRQGEHSVAAVPQPAAGRRFAEPAGQGVVLLVEDEAPVRSVSAEYLRELGYRVLEATDGPSALRILYGQEAPQVALMVTDLGLPNGLNGRQVADAARQRWPDLPVLLITGYAGDALKEPLAPGMMLMTKPFELGALAAKVQEMIGKAR